MTLNFDFAARNALADLGAGSTVSTIRGPEYHAQLGSRNLIFLHRDIDSPPDEIVLRTKILEEAWSGGWEEVITQRVVTSPVVVFVGLGSPAAVLFETTKRIIEAVGAQQVKVYVVDPSPYESSRFANEFQIPQEDYLRTGWSDFMRSLGQRVATEQGASIARDCSELSENLGIELEGLADLCRRLSNIGLLGLGRLRSKWMLDSAAYLPGQDGPSLRLFSSLILGVKMVENSTDRQAEFREDGLVDFSRDGYSVRALVCSGGGWRNKTTIEAVLEQQFEAFKLRGQAPSFALVAGVESGPETTTPSNITAETDPDDLVNGPVALPVVYVSELRLDPSLVDQVVR